MGKTSFVVDRDNLEVRMERVFDAPRQRVWDAMTQADMIPKWWGPRELTTAVEELDFKVGGKWRFVQTDPKGEKFAFYGVFKEISPIDKVVQTFEFEPFAGHVIVDTMQLEDLGAQTRVKTVSKYAIIEDLDGMVAAGMEGGAVEGQDRLAELVEKK